MQERSRGARFFNLAQHNGLFSCEAVRAHLCKSALQCDEITGRETRAKFQG